MAAPLDKTLYNDVLQTVINTIVHSGNRDDLWVLAVEIATDLTGYVQQTRQKANLMATPHDAVAQSAPEQTTPAVTEPDPAERDPENTAPLWLAKPIVWSDYWVYQYSNPVSTLHGQCGGQCVQTELWLVHRRTARGLFVDAEFADVDALHDFLDPRVELTKAANVCPLDQIDAELAAGDNDDQAGNDAAGAPKKSTGNRDAMARFVAAYKKHDGNTDKIMAEIGFASKQSVYSYKNKAKTQGLL